MSRVASQSGGDEVAKYWLLVIVGLLLFVAYVGLYLGLSRRGYAVANRYGMVGCASRNRDGGMRERELARTSIRLYRQVVSRWGVAAGGCKPVVKQLPLKGPIRHGVACQDVGLG
jgi:hypothetical protein